MAKRPNLSQTCETKNKIMRPSEECKQFISICTECFAPMKGTAKEITYLLKSHICNANEAIDRFENFRELQRLIKAIEPTKPAPPPPPMPSLLFETGASNHDPKQGNANAKKSSKKVTTPKNPSGMSWYKHVDTNMLAKFDNVNTELKEALKRRAEKQERIANQTKQS